MIDPDLKYCPECNDEYRAEIEKCAACGIDLITGLQKIEMEEERQKRLEGRKTELSPDDDLVAIRRGPLADMRHLSDLLKGENIGTLLAGDDNSCSKSCCPSVYDLLVKREDGMDALHIVEDEHKRVTGLAQHENANGDTVFNPHENEAQCPACGHSFPTTKTTCPDCGLSFG
jgi:ribosomal protein L37E